MRGTAAPAFFSLGLPSALLKQTRSSGVNASSRHSQRARRKRGGTHISRTEWGGVGVASRKPESAPLATLPLISVSSPGGAAKHWDWTRPCRYPHSVSRLRLVGTVRTYLGAAESLVSCASNSVVAFLHGAHGPGRSLYIGRSCGNKGTITNEWSFISVISGELVECGCAND